MGEGRINRKANGVVEAGWVTPLLLAVVLLLSGALVAVGAPDNVSDATVKSATAFKTREPLFVSAALWKFKPTPVAPYGDRSIAVCWEPLDGPSADGEFLKLWAADQVRRTWGSYGAIAFVGWEDCGVADSGVRLGLSTEKGVRPFANGYGEFLDGMEHGVVLVGGSSHPWMEKCRKVAPIGGAYWYETCFRWQVTHLLGHALGLMDVSQATATETPCLFPTNERHLSPTMANAIEREGRGASVAVAESAQPNVQSKRDQPPTSSNDDERASEGESARREVNETMSVMQVCPGPQWFADAEVSLQPNDIAALREAYCARSKGCGTPGLNVAPNSGGVQ